MFKAVVRNLILMCVGAAMAIAATKLVNSWSSRRETTPVGPTIEQVRELSELVTMSVDVADVQLTDLRGWTGGIRVAMLVRGQYLLGTDLSAARFESIDSMKRTAVLVLPPPRATTPRLDHDRTKLFAISPYGVWQIVPSNRAEVAAVNQAFSAAQASVTTAANNGTQVAGARKQAESVIRSFSRAIEWDVTVHWSDRP